MKINLHCPINTLSYGLVGSNINKSLIELGHSVSLFPINEYNIECEPHFHDSVNKARTNALLFDSKNICVKIYHQFALASRIGSGQYVGMPIFEMNRFTPLELNHMRSCDKLFVCSKWAKKVCDDTALLPETKVVPLGVDNNIFKPSGNKVKIKTIFLNISKWEKRKGHDILPTVFEQAFSNNDNVELWMMCENSFLSPEEVREFEKPYKNSKLSSKIRFIPRQPLQNQVSYIYNQAHFTIFPSRCEGWNLPALESMACGTPPIITNYSAHTEFCNEYNSLLVNFDELEEANDGKWFKPQALTNVGEWGKFTQNTIDQLIEQMRIAHSMNMTQDRKLQVLKENCITMAQKLTWENSATILAEHLQS
jgi:glycosyltransferase involved in cell wall biosynthesis